MKSILSSDHIRASVMLYSVVAFNTTSKSGHTLNHNEAAKVLAQLLQLDLSAPRFWLRGDFKKHTLSRENFLKIVRAYRGKSGLENTGQIMRLAIDLYGNDVHKALELLDPTDRTGQTAGRDAFAKSLLEKLLELFENSSPTEIRSVLLIIKTYLWFERETWRDEWLA